MLRPCGIAILLLSTTVSAQMGVGTSSPSNDFDVESNDATKTHIEINNNTGGGGDPALNLKVDDVTKFVVGVDNSDSDKFKIGTTENFSSTAVTVDASGNVGVGTATPVSGLDVQTSMGLAHAVVDTTPVTLDQTHNVVLVDDAGGDRTINLPAASSNSGKVYYIKKTSVGENEITIDGNSSETIDGSTMVKLFVQYDAIRILSDGSNWHIIADERKAHTCRLTRNTAQSISNGIWTIIDLNNEVLDVGGIGDPTTNNRIDIKRAGNYLISASVTFLIATDDYSRLRVSLNGTNIVYATTWNSSGTSYWTNSNITFERNLSAGDYLELVGMHDYGSALNTLTYEGVQPSLSVTEIR